MKVYLKASKTLKTIDWMIDYIKFYSAQKGIKPKGTKERYNRKLKDSLAFLRKYKKDTLFIVKEFKKFQESKKMRIKYEEKN